MNIWYSEKNWKYFSIQLGHVLILQATRAYEVDLVTLELWQGMLDGLVRMGKEHFVEGVM